ncbi:DUF397 domain-containing protein [Streptomyces somaliensis]|uniref:DUF397 domain-containing protein n=1 Tax=Streptomyces somaliensis TaxID=78355 RepID=UPI0020CF8E90|nr:DUF397 domain-containing protein [Streptomyces somaliensis]MCP9943621.1 DUF397 domain-containing protein [Streptomyces somaliensis]MCP9963133.1 DUF397 domain-containing protein [Streptomyces somaliensis]MCP9975979.1 DUF397 domain-containing protein [Streptomyces somaliensis]
MKRAESATSRVGPAWFKSSFSGAEGGQCVEVAAVPDAVLVRDSKHSAGPVLALAPTAWARFVEQAARD